MTAYLRDSIMVVLPQPLAPTMIVRGKQNAMTCSSSSGENDLTPLIDNLEMDAMMNIFICELSRYTINGEKIEENC